MKKLLSTIIGGSIAGLNLVAYSQVISVPGTSDPWLAGQPAGTTAEFSDVAPDESPVFAGTVSAGASITWTATGKVANGQFTPEGPNGDIANDNGYGLISHYNGAQNGISDVQNVPIDALMDVFLGPATPSGSAPGALDFSSLGLN
jgi:hypothetical protein